MIQFLLEKKHTKVNMVLWTMQLIASNCLKLVPSAEISPNKFQRHTIANLASAILLKNSLISIAFMIVPIQREACRTLHPWFNWLCRSQNSPDCTFTNLQFLYDLLHRRETLHMCFSNFALQNFIIVASYLCAILPLRVCVSVFWFQFRHYSNQGSISTICITE